MFTWIGRSQPNSDRSTRHQPIALTIVAALWLLVQLATGFQHTHALTPQPPSPSPTVLHDIGEPVSHIQCEPGYTATLYARGLHSPDGLAFDPAGVLHVVEEGARRISRVNRDGNTMPVWDDLRSPEGIAFDETGNLYVVEDTYKGRLMR